MIETDPEFLALMAACRERPADDAPRLVLSDWLEEHDEEPWAELIRVQCELARLEDSDGRRYGLRQREAALQEAHWHEWFGDLPAMLDRLNAGTAEESQTGPRARLLDAGLREEPAILDFILGSPETDPRLAADVLAVARGLPTLRIKWDALGRHDIQAWFRTPRAGRLLRTLVAVGGPDGRLPFGPLGVPAGLRASLAVSLLLNEGYARICPLPPLQEPNPAFDYQERLPASFAEYLTRLRRSRFMTEDFPSVVSLTADVSEETAGEFWALLKDANLNPLEVLSLVEYDGGTAAALLRSKLFPSLTSLTVRCGENVNLSADVIDAAESGRVPVLERLRLTAGPIGDEGYARLMRSPCGRSLREFDFAGTGLSPVGLRAVMEAGLMDRVCADNPELTLSHNPLGDAGAALLAGTPSLARLTELHLIGSLIGDAGAAALSASPHLRHLTELDLSDNQIGERGAAALAASPHLLSLKRLHLQSNGLSAGYRRMLTARFGNTILV